MLLDQTRGALEVRGLQRMPDGVDGQAFVAQGGRALLVPLGRPAM